MSHPRNRIAILDDGRTENVINLGSAGATSLTVQTTGIETSLFYLPSAVQPSRGRARGDRADRRMLRTQAPGPGAPVGGLTWQ